MRRNHGEPPSIFAKPFQIWPVFLQGFPKKALAILGNFKDLQGFQTQRIHTQIFSPVAASFWTHFRRHRAVFDRLRGAGGVERVHAPRESAYFARWRMAGSLWSIRTGW